MKSSIKWLFVMCLVAIGATISQPVQAVDVDFHGYLEANTVIRWGNNLTGKGGWNYGFFDNYVTDIQQRNTLKFDVDVLTKCEFSDNWSLDKFHFTYRGAYDSIFDLKDWKNPSIRTQRGPSRFDYALDDIRFENDLREAFMDITYKGDAGSGFFRPGRQIVSWGEASYMGLMGRWNPPDASFTTSVNPDDLYTPLWSVRANYSLPPMTGFNVNFDLLWSPDIRPTQLSPAGAPYGAALSSAVVYDIYTYEQQWAGKVTFGIGETLNLSLAALRTPMGPAAFTKNYIILNGALTPTSVLMRFPMTNTYGGSFNYHQTNLDVVFSGEVVYTDGQPISGLGTATNAIKNPPVLGPPTGIYSINGYKQLGTWVGMLGASKNIWMRWLSTGTVTTGLEVYYGYVNDWTSEYEKVMDQGAWATGLMFNWNWFNGRLNPTQVFFYQPIGGGLFGWNTALTWTISKNWYAKAGWFARFGEQNPKTTLLTNFAGGLNPNSVTDVTLKLGFQW